MASADKTYINKEQYRLVKNWWLKTRKKQIRELGAEIYMYPFSALIHETYDNGYDADPIVHYDYDPSESDLDVDNMGEDSVVWNTSTKQNFWIAKNCPFDFIQEQIRAKLSEEFYQEIPDDLKSLSLIDKMTFDEPDCLMQIIGKNVQLYFWKNSDKGKTFFINNFLVYGTTFLYKIIYNFKNSRYQTKNFPYKVCFNYCGLYFEFHKNKMYHVTKDKKYEVYIPYFDFNCLKIPKFVHSWDKKDCEKYSANEIILSFENKIHDMSCYKKSSDSSDNKRLLYELPKYIFENIRNSSIKK